MELTVKYIRRKKCRDRHNRNFVVFILNGAELLRIKDPFEMGWEIDCGLHTAISNVRLENDKIWMTKTKFGKIREVSYPISKKKLKECTETTIQITSYTLNLR